MLTRSDPNLEITPCRLSLYYDSQDPFGRFGLEHFLRKYRFSYSDSPQRADVLVSSTPSPEHGPGIQIVLNTPSRDETCYLDFEGTVVPVFKRPARVEGHPLVITADGSRENVCSFRGKNRIEVGFDIFTEIGKVLAGCYDEFVLQNNKLGETLRRVPVVDVMEDFIYRAIKRAVPGVPLAEPLKWPGNSKFALILTHDVDKVSKTYQYLPSIFYSIKKADFAGLFYHLGNLLFRHGERDPYWTFKDICELENSLGVKSTFYFLSERGRVNLFNLKSWILFNGRYNIEKQQIKDSIKKLAGMGFEVGVHGSYQSYRDPALLHSEKYTLESIVGSEVIGIRQHYLNYDNNFTPLVHQTCGFKYDTSLGLRPDYGVGFRRGTSFPFPVMLPDRSVLPILEIPLIMMDTALGSGTAPEEYLNMIDLVEKYGGVLTVLWHTNVFNRKEYPERFELYHRIILKAKEKGAWMAKAQEVYEWILNGHYSKSENEG